MVNNIRHKIFKAIEAGVGKSAANILRYLTMTQFKMLANKPLLKQLNEYGAYSGLCRTRYSDLENQQLFSHALTSEQQIKSLVYHYDIVTRYFTAEFLETIRDREFICWSTNADQIAHTISLSISSELEYEGCLTLSYEVDNLKIYYISFTICPGSFFGQSGNTILVSRNQGVRGQHVEIARASKDLNDVFPAHALMSALEGLSLTLGINQIIGIASHNQITIVQSEAIENSILHYNDFWNTFETKRTDSLDYLISIPYALKNLKSIKSKHRKRTMHKRSIRRNISFNAQKNIMQNLNTDKMQSSIKRFRSEANKTQQVDSSVAVTVPIFLDLL